MNQASPTSGGPPVSCGATFEEALNLYVDGELPQQHQPMLFAHLAACEHCRRTLDGIIRFRQFSRQELLTVPPAVDDAFFKRLARAKETNDRVDRAADRKPLWQARTRVSVRGLVSAAIVLFLTGLFIPINNAEQPERATVIRGEEERVEFPDKMRYRREAIYVIYPGLIVEASKAEEHLIETESL